MIQLDVKEHMSSLAKLKIYLIQLYYVAYDQRSPATLQRLGIFPEYKIIHENVEVIDLLLLIKRICYNFQTE